MSNLDATPTLRACGGLAEVAPQPVHQVFAGTEVLLGESQVVRRLLPNLGRRLVGPWCFVDHYGPDDVADGPGMQVPPHPHIGLQTVSWLSSGTVHHSDSLGSSDVLGPGDLGVMTAGRGITHAEYSPVAHPALLHGVQLWVALPEAHAGVTPSWSFHADLPTLPLGEGTATVFMGTMDGAASPGPAYSPLVGADIAVQGTVTVPLEPAFEHAVLVTDGAARVDGELLNVGSMLYLGCARHELRLDGQARVLLLGGAPFEERIVMWWNFVGRSHEQIADARADWIRGAAGGFGDVDGFDGFRLPAPELPAGRLRPGGATR